MPSDPTRHTSNSFTKLDVDSRTAAEAPPYEHDPDQTNATLRLGTRVRERQANTGRFAREFAAQNGVDMDKDETAHWRQVPDLEAAATFRRTVNLNG
ncbi:hypothetical protein [Intrasporangium sp.]|uniref:hypothetical protein n=1 Tax=Intrasporangium sp. TaxID=1925024 RepID=UPI0032219059